MKRISTLTFLALVALAATALRADVKTTQKTLTRLEGMMGGVASAFGGSGYNDGVTKTVAVKGNRMSTIGSTSGSIIDLTEQKVYILNTRSKDYTVMTFAEMRAQMDKAREQMKANAEQMKGRQGSAPQQPEEKPGTEMVTDMDVKETGQHKQVAGIDTKETVITLSTHEKGKTLEKSGGTVLTLHTWLAPSIPGVDEIHAFNMKYAKAAYGDEFAAETADSMQAAAMYPGVQQAMSKAQQESAKIQGTSLASSTTFETVWSDDTFKQMQADAKKNQNNGGGFGAMLAAKMGGGGPAKQRNNVVTITLEYLTIEKTASAADVAIPAGYTLKK